MNNMMKLATLSALTLVISACTMPSGHNGVMMDKNDKMMADSSAWKTMASSKGKIFTNQDGMALYTFRKDAPGLSNCYGACATAWPPFMAATGAKAKGAWSVIARKDGSKQWALNGKPLYFFAADKTAGDVKGDGVNGVWDLARPGDAMKAMMKKETMPKQEYGSSSY